MTTFKPWTPPPGVAVVAPPVHPETRVDAFYSDGGTSYGIAGDLNWSAFGDGPTIVAYAVVEEYRPAPEPREWWFSLDDDFDDDIAVLHESYAAADDGRRDGYGRICNRREIIHVREVLPAAREVVAWAVVRADGTHAIYTDDNVKSARWYASEYGGTVVRLTGVMP